MHILLLFYYSILGVKQVQKIFPHLLTCVNSTQNRPQNILLLHKIVVNWPKCKSGAIRSMKSIEKQREAKRFSYLILWDIIWPSGWCYEFQLLQTLLMPYDLGLVQQVLIARAFLYCLFHTPSTPIPFLGKQKLKLKWQIISSIIITPDYLAELYVPPAG